MNDTQNLLVAFASLSLDIECNEYDKTVLKHIEKLKSKQWTEFIFEAEKHALVPLIFYHLNSFNYQLDDDVNRMFKALVFRHKSASNARYQALKEIIQACDTHQIDFIALKGIALCAMLYPSVELRPMGDIDLLIDKKDACFIRKLMKELNFDMLDHKSKYMKSHHHLPSADKTFLGMNISIEWHISAIGRDYTHSLYKDDNKTKENSKDIRITWGEINYRSLDFFTLLNQLCHNISGVEYYIKFINIVDIYALLEKHKHLFKSSNFKHDFKFSYNVIRCLHLYVPLPDNIRGMFEVDNLHIYPQKIDRIGQSMKPVSQIFDKNRSLKSKINDLFFPSTWWLHLFYAVPFEKSLLFVRCFKHPMMLLYWLTQRFITKNQN